MRDDLACLRCEYSLRGLPGAIVTCPECGLEHDVALVIARQWREPWHRAPKFNRLIYPLAWLFCGGLAGWLPLFILDMERGHSPYGVVSILAAVVVAVGWALLLLSAHRALTVASGLALALLAHALFAGYIVGIVIMIWGALGTAVAVMSGGGPVWVAAMIAAIVVGIGCGLVWACQRGEKYIASHCIRNHLLER
jgi:hypothetical protein